MLLRPGYIAGVCNPKFADKPSWWDVLCNMETGKIIVSKDIEPAPPSGGGSGFSHPPRTFSRATASDAGLSSYGGDDDNYKPGGAASAGTGKVDSKADTFDSLFMEEVTIFTQTSSLYTTH